MAWAASAAQRAVSCLNKAKRAPRAENSRSVGLGATTLAVALVLALHLAAMSLMNSSNQAAALMALSSLICLIVLLSARAHPHNDNDESPVADATQTTPSEQASPIDDACWSALRNQISHELRTPLNAIIGFTEVMGSEIYGPVGHPRYREYLAHIETSGRALLRSTESTLALAEMLTRRRAAETSQTISLATLVADVIASVPTARIAYNAPTSLADSLIACPDPEALREAMTSLIVDATATAVGRSITLTAQPAGTDLRLELTSGPQAPEAWSRHAGCRVVVARALLALQGASLSERRDDALWRMTVTLPLHLDAVSTRVAA